MTSPVIELTAWSNPMTLPLTNTAAMPDKIPKNAPSSVGAGMKRRSSVIIPRKTGKTAVAQTRSATRNRPMTLNLYELKMTAGILTRMRRPRVIQRAVLSLTPKRRMSLLITEAMAVCKVSTEDAASAVTIMRTMTCQKVLKGAKRSKNARSSQKRKTS